MTNIILRSRYGDKYPLTYIDDNHYLLKGVEYLRIGFKEGSKEIDFIDPPGGPLIDIGYRLRDDKFVTAITKAEGEGYIIEVK